MTQPAVPSAVSYEDVREGNDSYRAFGQWTHSHQTGIEPVRRRCICQHHDGDGASPTFLLMNRDFALVLEV